MSTKHLLIHKINKCRCRTNDRLGSHPGRTPGARRAIVRSFRQCAGEREASSGLPPDDRPRPRSIRPGCSSSSIAELLDHRQRRIVGKHFATRADAKGRGSGCHVREPGPTARNYPTKACCGARPHARGARPAWWNARRPRPGSNRSILGCGRIWRGGADRRRHPA